MNAPVDRTLSSLVPGGSGILCRDVMVAAARVLEVPLPVMTMSVRGTWPESKARQIAIVVALEITGRSLPTVARCFGGRDHTTILHARRAVERRSARDLAHAELVERVKAAAIEEASQARARWQRLADELRDGRWRLPPPPVAQTKPETKPDAGRLRPLLGRAHPVRVVYLEGAA